MIVQQRVALGGGLTLEVGAESAGSSDPLVRIQSDTVPATHAAIPARLLEALLRSARASAADTVLGLDDVRDCIDQVAASPRVRKAIPLRELINAIAPDNVHEEIGTGVPVGEEVW